MQLEIQTVGVVSRSHAAGAKQSASAASHLYKSARQRTVVAGRHGCAGGQARPASAYLRCRIVIQNRQVCRGHGLRQPYAVDRPVEHMPVPVHLTDLNRQNYRLPVPGTHLNGNLPVGGKWTYSRFRESRPARRMLSTYFRPVPWKRISGGSCPCSSISTCTECP